MTRAAGFIERFEIIGRLLPLVIALGCMPQGAGAHGNAGERYFPPTIEVDDPFAADELHAVAGRTACLPGPTCRSSTFTFGVGMEPVDGWGVSVDATYLRPNPALEPVRNGFDDLQFVVRKELVINDEHEYAISAAVVAQAGGTGSSGARSRSVFAPTLYYAKGFGDLPHSMPLLRPFAVTGVISREIPADRKQPARLDWGFTVQYSLLYLQSHVGDFGLRPPFDRLILVTEFPVTTCVSSCPRETRGTINPGAVWVGKRFNLALEAVHPINARSGRGTGILFQYQQFFSE